MLLEKMTKEELLAMQAELIGEYEGYKAKGLKLNMARGKPAADQLALSAEMMNVLSADDYKSADGTDIRNYGVLDGLYEAKEMLGKVVDATAENTIVFGTSSLNIMYDSFVRALIFGVAKDATPWGKQGEIKFLCPVPGYDRHFAICEQFGIKMINIPMKADGPDMDMVEELVANDAAIKGIWCVPKYSNPEGTSYSDETVTRLATMKTAADDFRIFWDNAYAVHHLDLNDVDEVLSIYAECEKAGNTDRPYMFCSTSKITFPGSGIASMSSSPANIAYTKKLMGIQVIGHDKINQLRHIKFLGDFDGLVAHMGKHAEILKPKFDIVLDTFNAELADLGCADWTEPKGGYFISFNTMNGCAKRVASLCKEAGVELTGAGATFPYGIDPEDKNIRIAPSFPPVSELKIAVELFCLCVKIASVEKLIG